MGSAEFGAWLKQQRKAHDLTREALAEAAHCSVGIIRHLEVGTRRPSRELLHSILRALGVPTDTWPALTAMARQSPTDAVPSSGIPPAWGLEQVPAETTTLVHREQEVADLAAYLHDPTVRIVTVVGPPGVGKTRLAIAAARQVTEHFPQGCVWVPLSTLSSGKYLLSAIVQALRLPQPAGDVIEQLFATLGKSRILFVLDNAEHILDGVPDIARLIDKIPQLTVLVTSREPLRIYGEHQVIIQPLAVYTTGHTSGDQAPSPAAQLFLDRVRLHGIQLPRSDQMLPSIESLCQIVDGVPLAIELIASQARWHPLPALLDQLRQDLTLLASSLRNRENRQLSIRAAIAWSYHLLPAETQYVYACLSVFAGSFDSAAAHAVVKETIPSPDTVQQHLYELAQKSLLTHTMDEKGSHFSMLYIVRDFAVQQRRAMTTEAALQRHYIQWILSQAPGNTDMAWSAQLQQCMDVDFIIDDLRNGLKWTRDHSIEMFAQLVAAYGHSWVVRGYIEEGIEWSTQVLPYIDDFDLSMQGKIYVTYGTLQSFRLPDVAIPLLKHGKSLAEVLQNTSLVIRVLMYLGGIYLNFGQYDEARLYYKEIFDLAIKHEDYLLQARVLNNLGVIDEYRGHFDEAMNWYQQSRIIYRTHKYQPGEALTTMNIGRTLLARGVSTQFFTAMIGWSTHIDQLVEPRLKCAGWLLESYHMYFASDTPAAWRSFERSLALACTVGHKRPIIEVIECGAFLSEAADKLQLAATLMGWTAAQRTQYDLLHTAFTEHYYGGVLARLAARMGSHDLDSTLAVGSRLAQSAILALLASVSAEVGGTPQLIPPPLE